MPFPARIAISPPSSSKNGLRLLVPALLVFPFYVLQGGGRPQTDRAHLMTLRTIYAEVKEMGLRPAEDFVQREFFIGAPDEDDTNKDISVNIFIQIADGTEKMRIDVTYLERTRENFRIKMAKETRHLDVIVGRDNVRIERSDYDDRELPKLTEEILAAIKDKKRLLKK